MKLLFKQRVFSWWDSYDIYDEAGRVVYTVKGQPSWGHKLHILDASGFHIGTVKEVVLTFLPRFELYIGEKYLGCIKKGLSFFRPRFHLDFNGWRVDGDFFEWDYAVNDQRGRPVALVQKELFHWGDTYTLDIFNPADALGVLMVALAIDAEKCSRD